MADYLTRGLSATGHINAIACMTTEMVEEARRRHDTWPVATAALGRTMTASAMLAAQIKIEGARFNARIDGGGPLGKICVDALPDGRVRGYVENPHMNYELYPGGGLNVGAAVGKDGYLTVIKDLGLKEPFVGNVALQSGEIGDDFTYYLATSEQIPSAVGVGVLTDDEKVLAAGGFIVQVMPEATEEEVRELEERVSQIRPVTTLLKEGYTPQQMVKMLVPDYEEMEVLPLKWECRCSRERCKSVLMALALKDLKEILDVDKQCDMHCEFCGTTYHFDEAELQQIYDERIRKIEEKMNDAAVEDRKSDDQ